MPDESISTTFHLAICLRNKGLACEFSNIVHVERVLKHPTEPPIGFQATTLAQSHEAHSEIFNYLAHNVKDIRPGADNKRPLDDFLTDAVRDYNTSFHLVPLPKASLR